MTWWSASAIDTVTGHPRVAILVRSSPVRSVIGMSLAARGGLSGNVSDDHMPCVDGTVTTEGTAEVSGVYPSSAAGNASSVYGTPECTLEGSVTTVASGPMYLRTAATTASTCKQDADTHPDAGGAPLATVAATGGLIPVPGVPPRHACADTHDAENVHRRVPCRCDESMLASDRIATSALFMGLANVWYEGMPPGPWRRPGDTASRVSGAGPVCGGTPIGSIEAYSATPGGTYVRNSAVHVSPGTYASGAGTDASMSNANAGELPCTSEDEGL